MEVLNIINQCLLFKKIYKILNLDLIKQQRDLHLNL